MNYCPNCGNKIEPGHHFCSNCGQKPTQEKPEKTQRLNTKKRNSWILPIIIIILIIAIGGIAAGVVIGLDSGGNSSSNSNGGVSYSDGENNYQPTYTPPHQISLYGPNQVLTSGTYGHQTETIQAGSVVTISWSADASVEIWVITDTQYSDWTTLGWTANYVGYKSGNYGTLTCSIANTDIYYLIISRPGAGLYSPATVYSATATW